ncbi:MAG: hypothetical protein IMZ53_10885, partial [Thermoplasmata archaeon]|nr:hypothetical protein [Thermoplasmata archaeon]
MKYFSLFSGIGGFELGIEKGVNVSYKSEYKEKNTRCGCSMDTGRNGNKTISDIGWEQQQYFEKNNSKIIENKRKEFNSWKCVGFSEIDKYAIQIYKKHFPEHKNYGDATKI